MQFAGSKGFTLIEVVVALLVLSLTFGSAMMLFNNSIKNRGIINEKIMAEWVAYNYAIAKQSGQWPKIGALKESVSMGRYKYKIESDVTNTASPVFRKLKITVYSDSDKQELTNIISYSVKDIRW